jgi:hypothetical protein
MRSRVVEVADIIVPAESTKLVDTGPVGDSTSPAS